MTFTLGLAAVWLMNAFEIGDRDVFIELPSSMSEDVLYVFPIEDNDIMGGGSGCGGTEPPESERPPRAKQHLVVDRYGLVTFSY